VRDVFDREIARPAVERVEGLLSEHSRYQDPPVAYPLVDTLPFRERMVADKLAEYETQFTRVFPDPLRVVFPVDPERAGRLLAGTDDPLTHPFTWGQAVPGGVTDEILIRDPRQTLTGTMTITAPKGAAVDSVGVGGDVAAPISRSEDGRTVTVGSTASPVRFGGSGTDAGVGVVLRLRAGADTASGTTLTGGTVQIRDAAGRVLSAGTVDVVVRDSLPPGHGFAAPGGLTDEIAVHVPALTGTGTMTVTAPAGTRIAAARTEAGTRLSIAGDQTTATATRTDSGAGAATVWVRLRVPAGEGNETYPDGRVRVFEDGIVRATGSLIASIAPVVVTQTAAPSLPHTAAGPVTVRLRNLTPTPASGLHATVTAPSGTVFDTPVITAKDSTGANRAVMGSLSPDKRTLAFTSRFPLPGNGWLDLTARLRNTTAGVGTIRDGAFTITGGNILPPGSTTRLAYTGTLARIPTVTASAGPGRNVDLVFPGPDTPMTGTLTLTAPERTMFQHVTTTTGAAVTYSPDRRTATIAPTRHGGNTGTVTARIGIHGDARPTHTLTGTVALTHQNTPTATGTYTLHITTEGCLHTTIRHIPASLITWFHTATIRNTCHADIDVRVPFTAGPDSGWATLGYLHTHTFWSTPWATPQPHQTNTITPHP
jgi:hypothetical protein